MELPFIMFEEDWKKERFKHAIVHTDTTNTSWIRFAGILRSMGVKNNMFHLSLLNPALRKVNVRDESLGPEVKGMVLTEMMSNPWYAMREGVKINSAGGLEIVDYKADIMNIGTIWLLLNNVMVYLLGIRQIGKSQLSFVLNFCILQYWGFNSNAIIITKDSTLRKEAVDAMISLEEGMPRYLVMTSNKDSKNTEAFTNESGGNALKMLLAQKSKAAAEGVARGFSATITQFEEHSVQYNNWISTGVALAAGTFAQENAINNGLPAMSFFTTNAAMLDTSSGAYSYSIYNGGIRFSAVFFDIKDREALHKMVKENSRGEFDNVTIEVNHRMVGKSDEWLKEKIRASGMKGAQAASNYLNVWGRGNTESFLDEGVIKRITTSEIDPIYTKIVNGYVIRCYKDMSMYKHRSFIIGVDSSEVIGKDDLGIVATDEITGEMIFTAKINRSNTYSISVMLYNLLTEFSNAICIIERKSTGLAILDNIDAMRSSDFNMFKRFYNRKVDLGDNDFSINDYITYKEFFGYNTSSAGMNSRSNLMGNYLEEICGFLAHTVKDKDLSKQLTNLVIKNGRVDHGNSKDDHDDLVIAWMLTHYFLKSAKNVDKYGLNASTVLSAMSLDKDGTDKAMLNNKISLMDKLSSILKEIKDTDSDSIYSMFKLENELRKVKRNLADIMDDNELQTLNIDARLKEIKSEARGKKNDATKLKRNISWDDIL